MWSAYTNVTNILVRVAPRNISVDGAVLMSAHYDAALGSPGASDDLAAVGVLLEVFRNIALDPTTAPKHALIFNFNGAEENILQASHGFVTQHPWRHEVKAFLNMEACGAGGREIVFQTGPGHPWLIELYARTVPRPHINVMAQEVFQTNVIPSDTDFRIYRDFGAIPGFDMAWFENGYVYHTKNDDMSQFEPGAIQHTGDNVLALVKGLGNAPELPTAQYDSTTHLIFFDFLGKAVFVWSTTTQLLVCSVVAAAVVWLVWLNRLPAARLGAAVKGYGIVMLTTILVPTLIGAVLPLLGLKMFWYARPFRS
jgi:hypothetical protein